MEDPQQAPSKPNPSPEVAAVPPPRLQPVDPRWAIRTGLLHVVNEAALWPLGFALIVVQDSSGNIGLQLMESDGPVVPEIGQGEHATTHAAFMQMLAHRFAPVEETAEERAAAEARKRIMLPGGPR